MAISLAIKTDEERLQRLRSEIRALEGEKSAIFSEVSAQRSALGEIARSTNEEIRIAQAASERIASAKYELEATMRTIAANRAEIESLAAKALEAKALAGSLPSLEAEKDRKKSEMVLVTMAIANEKGVLTGILREQEAVKRALESREKALEVRELSVFKKEDAANLREAALNEFHDRLGKRDYELKLKMDRLKLYAATI